MCSVSDVCTAKECPEMTAGPHYTYLWTDFHGSDPIPVFENWVSLIDR